MCLLPVPVRAIVGRTDAVRSTGSLARSCAVVATRITAAGARPSRARNRLPLREFITEVAATWPSPCSSAQATADSTSTRPTPRRRSSGTTRRWLACTARSGDIGPIGADAQVDGAGELAGELGHHDADVVVGQRQADRLRDLLDGLATAGGTAGELGPERLQLGGVLDPHGAHGDG